MPGSISPPALRALGRCGEPIGERGSQPGARRPAYDARCRLAREPGDIRKPDERLDSDGRSDRKGEPVHVRCGPPLAERREGVFDPADGPATTQEDPLAVRWVRVERQAKGRAELRLRVDRDARELLDHARQPGLEISGRRLWQERRPVDLRVGSDQQQGWFGK